MTLTDRASLEQIATGIKWPEELNEYVVNLKPNLTEEEKLWGIVESLHYDAQALKKAHFNQYGEKPITTLEQYARQRNWPTDEKVLIGAIDGILIMWIMLQDALRAFSWGSENLRVSPEQAVRTAKEMLANCDGVDLKNLTVTELAKLYLASEIVEEGGGISSMRLENPVFFSRLKGFAKREIEKGKQGYEDFQANITRESRAVRDLKEFLVQKYKDVTLWETDQTGRLFVTEAAKEIGSWPVERNVGRNLPFVVGRAAGSNKAGELYVARYELLH